MGRARVTRRRQAVLDRLNDDEELMFLEPPSLDAALIGVSCAQPGRPRCAVYDEEQLLRCFMRGGMTREDALEWMDFNTLGAWMGEQTPIVVERLPGGRGTTR